MIVFWDTSALMKLYVAEAHSTWVRQAAARAAARLVSDITWAEACAALAFKARTGQIAPDAVAPALAELEDTWPSMQSIAVQRALVRTAGDLALRFGLRAYDSVQLASAQHAGQLIGPAMRFCSFDKALNAAAKQLGLMLLQPDPSADR